ncbi:hypothetical protein BDK51DRAFT_25970 [Blyttiomyces helicus]|uniref:F-box domain-containing protein n=1 Tax=Blyttiomyces helicus TaxID=388810 RepID=A0A4P9WFC5_9FUNG|nr:hypothetical protein BDK51DRAFT_25970 [Blyttiomyces helicus]|eukprot:RKO91112.1 hypothetical protein BDK51DRAFT_25970 [Blyttiomyces helicus]
MSAPPSMAAASFGKRKKMRAKHEYAEQDETAVGCSDGRWAHFGNDLLRLFLLWACTITDKREHAPYTAALVCRGWGPTATRVLWEHVRPVVVVPERAADILSAKSCFFNRAAAPLKPLTDCFGQLSSLRGLQILKHRRKVGDCGSILTLLPAIADARKSLIALSIDGRCSKFGKKSEDPLIYGGESHRATQVPPHAVRLQLLPPPSHRSRGRLPAPDLVPDLMQVRRQDVRDLTPQPGHNRASQIISHDEHTRTFMLEVTLKLTSLHPSLRRIYLVYCMLESDSFITTLLAACPTITALTLNNVMMTTDTTLAALERHPLLHHLDIRFYARLSTPAIINFIRTRASELRFLRMDEIFAVDKTVMHAIATHPPRIETLCFRGCHQLVPSVPTEIDEAVVTSENVHGDIAHLSPPIFRSSFARETDTDFHQTQFVIGLSRPIATESPRFAKMQASTHRLRRDPRRESHSSRSGYAVSSNVSDMGHRVRGFAVRARPLNQVYDSLAPPVVTAVRPSVPRSRVLQNMELEACNSSLKLPP